MRSNTSNIVGRAWLSTIKNCDVQPKAFEMVQDSGYLLVNRLFLCFGLFPWKFIFFTRNEAQEQHSLLDTIFDYIFYFGPPGKYLYLSPKTHYMLAGGAGQDVVGFLDFFIDIFLEVQNKRFGQILYLIDYVVPGLHFW